MKAPYGWIWTRRGYRKLTPKSFNKRLRRAHNRRLMSRSLRTQETKSDNTTTEEDDRAAKFRDLRPASPRTAGMRGHERTIGEVVQGLNRIPRRAKVQANGPAAGRDGAKLVNRLQKTNAIASDAQSAAATDLQVGVKRVVRGHFSTCHRAIVRPNA